MLKITTQGLISFNSSVFRLCSNLLHNEKARSKGRPNGLSFFFFIMFSKWFIEHSIASSRNMLLLKMGKFTYFLSEQASSCGVFQRILGRTSGFSPGTSSKTCKGLALSKCSPSGFCYPQLSLQSASTFLVCVWGCVCVEMGKKSVRSQDVYFSSPFKVLVWT